MYHLQNRWKLVGNNLIYYGLRNKENMFKNKLRLTKKQVGIISLLPKVLTDNELAVLCNLVGEQIVCETKLKITPKSINEAIFCKSCSANDFIIPGMEFNDEGICPMCQTAEETKNLRSIVPIVKEIPRSKKSRL